MVVCIGVWNVYSQSADSKNVYKDNTGDQLIMCETSRGVRQLQRWACESSSHEPGGLGRSLARGYWCCN